MLNSDIIGLLGQLSTALVGFAGLVIGILVREYFRRERRIDKYAQEVFDRRLEAYEGLYKIVNQSFNKANNLIERTDLTHEERHAYWSKVIFELTEYCDENGLYLDEALTGHCVLTFIGIEEVADLDQDEREKRIEKFNRDYAVARKMLEEAAGMKEIEKALQSVSKPEVESEYTQIINRYLSRQN